MDFATMMTLEVHGPDTYVGRGPQYPWGGLYGGQIVAQALRAAASTVAVDYRVHSLHAYFIRRGDHDEPIRFEVERLRDGRSFVTRAVVARQSNGAILNMSASFQIAEVSAEVQAAIMPRVDRPETRESSSWIPMLDRRYVSTEGPGRATAWLRLTEMVTPDAVLDACALAYLSDDLPTEAVAARHPQVGDPKAIDGEWMSASLDHAIWFHGPARAGEWGLQDFRCEGVANSRGVATGHVFAADGGHVATVVQEVLLRHRDRKD